LPLDLQLPLSRGFSFSAEEMSENKVRSFPSSFSSFSSLKFLCSLYLLTSSVSSSSFFLESTCQAQAGRRKTSETSQETPTKRREKEGCNFLFSFSSGQPPDSLPFLFFSFLLLSFLSSLLFLQLNNWNCLACTFTNQASSLKCGKCGKRPDSSPSFSSSNASSSSSSSSTSSPSLLVDLVISRSTDPNASPSAALNWAETHGFDKLVRELLKDQSRRTIYDPLDFLVEWVCERRYTALLKLLLTDERIDPSADDQYPIRFACKNGHTEIVKLLLADQRVDPSSQDQIALCVACDNGYLEIVKLLLADQRVDPSADNQFSIREACRNGHLEIVKLLLADQRVDPSADNQHAVQLAGKNGHTEIVKLLLADQRVDPSVDEQYAIRAACNKSRVEVVKLLLADKRVDPSADDQYPIRSATGQAHTELVKLLLADQRVALPSSWPLSKVSPDVFPLFLLRRSIRRKLTKSKQQNQPDCDFTSVVTNIKQIEAQRKALLEQYLIPDLSKLCLNYVPHLFCHLDAEISTLIDESDSEFPRFSFSCLSTL
jgi:hypothetical protein